MSEKNLDFEKDYEELRKKVNLRDQMCGNLYWNIMNDECCELANEISAKGGDKSKISEILGKGTHKIN